jgi:hypothetical protein
MERILFLKIISYPAQERSLAPRSMQVQESQGKKTSATSHILTSKLQNKIFLNYLATALKLQEKKECSHAQGIAPGLHEMFHMRGHNVRTDPGKPPKGDCTIFSK